MKSNFVEEPHPKPRPGQTQRCACLWLPHPALDHEITARCIAILNRAAGPCRPGGAYLRYPVLYWPMHM